MTELCMSTLLYFSSKKAFANKFRVLERKIGKIVQCVVRYWFNQDS